MVVTPSIATDVEEEEAEVGAGAITALRVMRRFLVAFDALLSVLLVVSVEGVGMGDATAELEEDDDDDAAAAEGVPLS